MLVKGVPENIRIVYQDYFMPVLNKKCGLFSYIVLTFLYALIIQPGLPTMSRLVEDIVNAIQEYSNDGQMNISISSVNTVDDKNGPISGITGMTKQLQLVSFSTYCLRSFEQVLSQWQRAIYPISVWGGLRPG